MSTVCFSESEECIYYIILESEDGFHAEVDDKTNKILEQEFENFNTAKRWIKRIMTEHRKRKNEIDRYS